MSFEYSCFNEDIYLYNTLPYEPIESGIIGITYEDPSYEIVRNKEHSYCSIEYVYSGECVIQHNHEIFTAKAGDFFILHPHAFHHYYSNPKNPCKKIFLCLRQRSSFISNLISEYGLANTTHIPEFYCADIFEQTLDLAMHPVHDFSKHIHLNLQHILYLASSRLFFEDQPSSSITDLKNYLENNLTSRISVDDCCEISGLKKFQLYKIFRDLFSTTPIEYHMRLKIDASKAMLEKTNLTVSEIAEHFDFYDPYHFSKTFKKYVGVSPTEYRSVYENS